MGVIICFIQLKKWKICFIIYNHVYCRCINIVRSSLIISMQSNQSYRWINWMKDANWHLILVSNLCDTFYESPCGQLPWAIHSLSVIIWSPGGTVDIDMLGVETQRSGLHCISNVPVQHPYTCTMTVIRLHQHFSWGPPIIPHGSLWSNQVKKCWHIVTILVCSLTFV